MSRLTWTDRDDGLYADVDGNEVIEYDGAAVICGEIVRRLAFFEDLFDGIPDERLAEIAQAEKDGRCKVLPFATTGKYYMIGYSDLDKDKKEVAEHRLSDGDVIFFVVRDTEWEQSKLGYDDDGRFRQYSEAHMGYDQEQYTTRTEAVAALAAIEKGEGK